MAGGITLDAYDSHMDLQIEEGQVLFCMHTEGFQYLWKGGRATAGIRSGKFMYEVKVLEDLPVTMPDTPPKSRHVCRAGFSLPLTPLYLGDTPLSWGFGGTGKESHDHQYEDFGEPFGVGNVMGCIVDLDLRQISFTKDGHFLGTAFTDLPGSVADHGIFPHVLLKNVRVQLNFSRASRWYDPPGEEVLFFDEAAPEVLVPNPVEHPKSHAECEFVMLVGLPAAGKTYWAEGEKERKPAKNYVVLGTNALIDQMRVVGVGRRGNYSGRWSELIRQAQPVFDKLLQIASSGQTTPRNIILDQTNVYRNARERKAAPFLKLFGKKRCVIFVNDDAEQERREEKVEREEGKCVPNEVVMEMAVNFAVPDTSEGYDEVTFVGLPESEAKQQVQTMNEYGKEFKASGGTRGPRRPKPPLEKRSMKQIGQAARFWWGEDAAEGAGRAEKDESQSEGEDPKATQQG